MKLHHSVPHDLGLARAREVLEQAFTHYQERYPHAHMQRRWEGEREARVDMKVGGFHLQPRIVLADSSVAVEVDVPLLARPWVPRIRDRIEREIGQWLQEARRNETPI